jgi:hypothetical protein
LRYDVVGVGQRSVDGGIGNHHAGDAADGEEEDEANAMTAMLVRSQARKVRSFAAWSP